MVIAVVPSHAFRDVIAAAAPHVPPNAIVLSATKGIDVDSGERMSEQAERALPDRTVAVLSGPSFAQEVAAEQPTAVVVACAELASA